MEMVLKNQFSEMSFEEMDLVNGGGVKQAAQVFMGVVLVAFTPAVGVGASIVGTPAAGAVAAGGTLGLGLTLIGAGTH